MAETRPCPSGPRRSRCTHQRLDDVEEFVAELAELEVRLAGRLAVLQEQLDTLATLFVPPVPFRRPRHLWVVE